MKIYTKSGDQGQTGLIGGDRVSKDDARIELYGTVDELNSTIGIVASSTDHEPIRETLYKVQRELFNLGSNLACHQKDRKKFKLTPIHQDLVVMLERKIDDMDSELEVLENFILPGGCQSASYCHLARTVCRRTERRLITFESKDSDEKVQGAVVLLNRLSDYLFVLARYFNLKENINDIPWH